MVTRRVGRDIVMADWGGLILDCGSNGDCDDRLHFDLWFEELILEEIVCLFVWLEEVVLE